MATAMAQPNMQQQPGSQPKGDDPSIAAPDPITPQEAAAALEQEVQTALMGIRRKLKERYLPKRMRFVQEGMRAFEALRGNTYALLNDQSAALDTINTLMQGFLGAGDDPQLYAHNDNIYQMFCMSFIAALMVDLGKVRYQPADAQDGQDVEIARKASKIQAYNERKNDIESLQQLELLYLWLTGSYFCYVRYIVGGRAGMTKQDKTEIKPVKVQPDGYICPSCGAFVSDKQAGMFSDNPDCPKCGAEMTQKDWYEGQMMDLPVNVGEIEVANGMTAFDIYNGLMVDANPDVMTLGETEILDLTLDISPGKVRSAYPNMYEQIGACMGTDSATDGDMARTARQAMTTPGSNNRAITTSGLVSYSRCWITPEAFYEWEDKKIADELRKRYPDGCKLVQCGENTFLDAKNESLTKRWTWGGTVKGLGLYPFAAGKVCLDVQERVTGAVNKIDAYMDRVAYGTMLYDADFIDGNAMANKVLTPGNLTGVSRTDEETGQRVPLEDLMYQPTFHIDAEIYKYPDNLTMRAQMLSGVMPQIFGGSDKNVQTAQGQEQALNTALGRLKQYINQMREEKAKRARISVMCTIENMDEEVKVVEEGDTKDSYQTIRMLKAELTGDFFTYPETDEGFPASYKEIQARLMQLLAENQKLPFITQLLGDPDIAAIFARYLLPEEVELPEDAQLAKIKTILNRLSQDPQGAILQPNPNPTPGQPPTVAVPSILPEPGVDDPAMCRTLGKKWLLKNWQQRDTNPPGYGNVLAWTKVSGQLADAQAATATLNLAAQHAQGQGAGAGQGAPPAGA